MNIKKTNRNNYWLMAACIGTMLLMGGSMASCKECKSDSGAKKTSVTDTRTIKPVVLFQSDSAYNYIAEQVAFGPRVPGTPEHDACARYLQDKLRGFGADSIIVQQFNGQAYNGDRFPLTNIMGRFNIDNPNRILLLAHYDTRPWADREKNPDKMKQPILGANDGASGVGVLLEIARQIQRKTPSVGVDILFVDGEDYGKSAWTSDNDSTWCLGSQYWIKHMPADYEVVRPRFGILLDMVGAHYARFHREFISEQNASQIVDKVWSMAVNSGYSRFFINKSGGSIVDDHLYVNRVGIPTVDIIDANNELTGTFPGTWHTLNDDMNGISQATLRTVGQTVSNVLYYEK